MALVESGLARPNWAARTGQEHLRVFFFSLGKLGRAPVASFLSALVIGVALALPGGLYVLTQNLAAVGYSWQESLQISLFLKDSVTAERGAALAREIQAEPGVARSLYLSREQSLADFRRQSGFDEALQILQDNPLPAVIAVTPDRTLSKPRVEQLAVELGQRPEVDIAKLDQQWLERLHALLDIARRAVAIVATLLGLAVLVIVGNTIRLDIEARRDEIEVMKLIGAPDSFIRRPFLYAGFWYGLGGGLLGWLFVALAVAAVRGPAQSLAQAYGSSLGLSGLSWADGLLLLGAGVALGWLGAWISVGRRLALIEPR